VNRIQNVIVKPTTRQATRFPLGMPRIDDLFPGFEPGDFAVLYGSPSITSLMSLMCVRAQLPQQLGGLSGNVVFIEGGNTFRLYKIARLAHLHKLNPTETLKHIFISRAFTAHQLTALIMEKLEETIKAYNPKLIIISDVSGFFLDENVEEEEAKKVYSQVIEYLSDFAKKNQVVLTATYLPYGASRRSILFQDLTFKKTCTVLRFTKTKYFNKVSLEKHPHYALGTVELPSQTTTLLDFMDPRTNSC
jgi:hypothetical protein